MKHLDESFVNSELFVDPTLEAIAGNSICLSGVARSGTTILGTLVHSLKGVEYAFEPPSLVHLFYTRRHMDPNLWYYYFCHYLYEDILIPAISGRGLNFNSNDWSYIFNAKSVNEIRARFTASMRTRDAPGAAASHVVAFKIPNVVNELGFLNSAVPGLRTIISIRHPDEVTSSLLARNWFSGLGADYHQVGPVKQNDGVLIPGFISEEISDQWVSLTETDRCYASYADCYMNYSTLDNSSLVDYCDLVASPGRIASQLGETLGLEFGDCTSEIIAKINVQKSSGRIESRDSVWRKKAIDLYFSLRDHCLTGNS